MPEEASELEPGPTELDEVVYVVSALCDECGDRSLTDPSQPHKASTFRENKQIWCGKCKRGLMSFTLSHEPPRAAQIERGDEG